VSTFRSRASCSLVAALVGAGIAFAADHDDTNALKTANRHDARVTDLHVFTVGSTIVFAVSTNPNIPKSASSYIFPSDLKVTISVDGHSGAKHNDAFNEAHYGGNIKKPNKIAADQTMTVTFDGSGAAHLNTTGFPGGLDGVDLFTGLRDDPFIRGPRTERNVGAIVLQADLRAFTTDQSTLLVWVNSEVPSSLGTIGDLGARALRSQFAANLSLNDYPPNQHQSVLGVYPDVLIFDTTRPATFPNGRALTDDAVDLVCGLDEGAGTCLFASDCAPSFGNPYACQPTTNDHPFLETFPYLAEPNPPCGALGQICCTVMAQCATVTCLDGTCQ
jgi:hypothetical protein